MYLCWGGLRPLRSSQQMSCKAISSSLLILHDLYVVIQSPELRSFLFNGGLDYFWCPKKVSCKDIGWSEIYRMMSVDSLWSYIVIQWTELGIVPLQESQIGEASCLPCLWPWFNFPSWLHADHPGCLEYTWAGIHEPCCFQIFLSLLLKDKTQPTKQHLQGWTETLLGAPSKCHVKISVNHSWFLMAFT